MMLHWHMSYCISVSYEYKSISHIVYRKSFHQNILYTYIYIRYSLFILCHSVGRWCTIIVADEQQRQDIKCRLSVIIEWSRWYVFIIITYSHLITTTLHQFSSFSLYNILLSLSLYSPFDLMPSIELLYSI